MSAGKPLTAASCCTAAAHTELHAIMSRVISQAKRERMTMPDVLTLLLSVWSDTCSDCGEECDLYASDGARICTSCATPEAVRQFLEGAT